MGGLAGRQQVPALAGPAQAMQAGEGDGQLREGAGLLAGQGGEGGLDDAFVEDGEGGAAGGVEGGGDGGGDAGEEGGAVLAAVEWEGGALAATAGKAGGLAGIVLSGGPTRARAACDRNEK